MKPERCSFAFPGTYGHECGKPATIVGIKPSESTTNGVFYSRRCAECAKEHGGDNLGIKSWEPYDPEKHVNQWKPRRAWPE